MTRLFRSNATYWTKNRRTARRAQALPAVQIDPEGREVPGVALITDTHPRVVLTVDEMRAFALALIDAAEVARQQLTPAEPDQTEKAA
ncbi:hypothetical protein M3E04_001390 [Micrococcus luteus]|nr:hypothetical protein [Micrococcus luteus]